MTVRATRSAAAVAVVLAVMFLAAANLFAQVEAPVSITATADKTKVTIGDPIKYVVRVIYDKEFHVKLPPAGTNLGSFEIRDFEKKGPTKLSDGKIEETYNYVVAVYDTGKFDIPPVVAEYWKTEKEKDDLKTKKITIEVASIQGKNAKDIQDIKPPLSARPNFIRYALIGAAILALLCGAGYFAARALKKRKESRLPGYEPPARKEPAHVAALRKLAEVEAADLPGKGEIKLYYIEISEIVRQYVGERFRIVTMERTTDEIMRDMRSANINREHAEMIRGFLMDSDMVKFAKRRPARDVCRDDIARARKIIESTTEGEAGYAVRE